MKCGTCGKIETRFDDPFEEYHNLCAECYEEYELIIIFEEFMDEPEN